jgi:TolB-like protein/class 3 adenylate cyclase/Flp pilus assembly protein TadD
LPPINSLPGKEVGSATTMTSERVERRLAAILACDVAGYSRLMGANEVGTLEALKAHRREVVDPAIAERKGRIVKTTGDGMLVEFASAVDAVTCAIAIQEELAERRASGAEPRITFRIGINVGDIIIDGDDILGDGVNIAARVENECEPGGVYVSGNVFEQIRGKTKFTFDDLGEKTLKNIERPVRLYAVRGAPLATTATKAAVSVIPSDNSKPLPLPDKPSIAVLPFQNMSGDPEQEYFADGMVEDITTALSRVKWLFVIARNSSFTYKGKAVDIKQVGRELGVRYVLEGSVRKAGNKVRITGQLIEVSTNAHLWADRFDGGLEDIFDLQDQISASIVGAISPKLEDAEIALARKKPTHNLGAYDYYQRGLALLYQFTKEGHEQSMPLLRKAVELDPDFALAQAAIAGWYISGKAFVWIKIGDREIVEADQLARRLLRLSNDDARVLAHAGQALTYVVGNLKEGAPVLDQAIRLDPNLAVARLWGGGAKMYRGELDAAIEHFQHAVRLSPLEPRTFLAYSGLASAHFLAGRYDKALECAMTGIRQWPNFVALQRIAAACYAKSGRVEDAKRAWLVALQLDPTQRISNLRNQTLFRNEDFEKFAEAYRIMGMPE